MGVPLNFLIQQWTFCLVQSQLSVTCFDFSTWHLGTLHIVLLPHTIFHTPLCHTPSFTHNFHTHTHTIFHTKLCHIHHFLCRTPSHFVTHNSSHTTCFTSRSSTTSFVFPSFPLPSTTFVTVAHYWKKLTCGVIRSFSFHNIWDNPSHWLIFFRGVGQPPTRQHILNFPSSICSKQLQYFWILTIKFPQFPSRSHHYFLNNNPPEDVDFSGHSRNCWCKLSIPCISKHLVTLFLI